MINNFKIGLMSECQILINRLYYLEKKTNDSRPKNSGYSTPEEEEKVKERMTKYRNDNIRRNIKIKAYFVRLILDLIHLILKNEPSQNIARKIEVIPKQKRFKRKKQVDINNLEELIFFFRDAICHPEEKSGEFSPRRSVKYNLLDENMFMYSFFDETTKDVFFKMGDYKIRLLHMKNFLKQI